MDRGLGFFSEFSSQDPTFISNVIFSNFDFDLATNEGLNETSSKKESRIFGQCFFEI